MHSSQHHTTTAPHHAQPHHQPTTASHHAQPHHAVRSPEVSGSIRRPSSQDRPVARSFAGTLGASEFPIVDAQARYSISYVPGMSEHMVNTGKTLPEAQLKVVLFACEVERLNTLNYNLVKENEILKAQGSKSNREADLETKLAIVLAENEKLNQIVEELQDVYSRERESLANEDYERRIAELLHEAEDWKHKYKKLEVSSGDSGNLRHIIEDLQRERESLREQLGRQGRDLDALRARFEAIQVGGPSDVKLLREQITHLKIDNEKLNSELHTMKLKYGNADSLQQKLSQYDSRVRVLLDENDKLNHLLAEKSRELSHAREVSLHRPVEEKVVRAVATSPVRDPRHAETVDRLTRDNEELRGLLLQSQGATHGYNELREKSARLAAENDRLNSLVIELRTEAENLRRQVGEGHGVVNRKVEQLTVQITSLLDENHRLNALLESKSKEEDFRVKSAQLISENDRLNILVRDLRAENEALRKHAAEAGKTEHLTVQLNGLLAENHKLNDTLGHRLTEIESLKNRNRELELGSSSVGDLRNKVGILVSETERLNRLVTDLAAENDRLKRQATDATRITELTTQINTLLAENGRLNESLGARLRELETSRHRIHELETSSVGITELRTSNERLLVQIHELRTENDRLKVQIESERGSSVRISQLTAQINNLLEENQKLNSLIHGRSGDTEVLRRRITELEAASAGTKDLRDKLVLVTTDNERLNSLVIELRAETDRLKRQSIDTSQINHLNIQIGGLHEENRKLNSLLAERSEESDRLRRRVPELETSVGSLRNENERLIRQVAESSHSKERLDQLTHQINALLSENQRLNTLLVEKHEHGSKVTELTAQINGLTAENRRLNELLSQRSSETDSLRRRILEIDASSAAVTELKSKLSHTVSENERLTHLLNEHKSEIDKLRIQVAEASRASSLTGQLNSLLNENQRLNESLIHKSGEVDSLRRRVVEAEDSKNRVTVISSENERLTHEINDLRAEIERLKAHSGDTGRVHELTAHVSGLNDENRKLSSLVADRSSEVDTLKRRAHEADDLREENRRLHSEIDRLRLDTSRSYESNIQLTKLQDDNKRQNTLILELQSENDRLRIQGADAHGSRARIDQLTLQVNTLLAENSRVTESLSHRISEVDQLKLRLATTGTPSGNLNDLRAVLVILAAENERLSALVEQNRTRTSTDETSGLRNELEDLRRKNQSLVLDSQSFNGLLKDRTNEIDSLRQKVYTLETSAREADTLRLRLSQLEEGQTSTPEGLRSAFVLIAAENDRLNALIRNTVPGASSHRTVELAQSGPSVSENLLANYARLEAENERLNRLLASTGGAHQAAVGTGDVHINVGASSADVESLRRSLAEKDNEIETLRKRLMFDQSSELRSRVEVLLNENEQLNNHLTEKMREVESLRRRVAELEGKPIPETKEEHHGFLSTVKDKIVHGIEKITEPGKAESQAQIDVLTTERDTLKRLLEDKTREVEGLRARIDEGRGGEIGVDIHRHDEGAKKAGVLPVERTQEVPAAHGGDSREEVNKLRTILAEKEREIESLGRRNEEADFLRQENNRVNRLLTEKLREIEELGKRSVTPSTLASTTAGTERSQEVEDLRRRIAELEAAAAQRGSHVETRQSEEGHETQHSTGIFGRVKDKIAHGIERLTGTTEGTTAAHEGTADLEAEYTRLLDAQISDVNARFNEERQQFQRNEEDLSLKIQELEEKLNMTNAEKDKLIAASDKSKQEIENWKRKYEHFENQKDMEMDSLKLELEKKYRDSPARKGVPDQIIDLEDRVTFLNNEIERLQDHLNMTLTELEEWRKRYSELEVLRAQEIDELRQQFDNSKKSSIEAKELQVKFNAERTAYEAQILQLQQKAGDLQILTAENERLNKLSITRLEELEDLRRAQGGSTSLTSSQTLEVTQLKTQIESYKAASLNVKQLAIKYSAEKAADLSQIRQLKQINENYKSELEKLYELLDERKADFESLTKQNEELLKMYEKLVVVSTEKGGDVSSSQERTSQLLPKELSELESTREQYQRNSIELTRKNKELVDKLQELDILKMKYEEALANYQALNTRLFEKLNSER